MITRKNISRYFDLEADAAYDNWQAMMSLPVRDRVHKRIAIDNVFLDEDYRKTSDNDYELIKVRAVTNLSDFKEGDPLVLHDKDSFNEIECTLVKFEGDTGIILEVFPLNMPEDLKLFYGIPLVLDKALVDLSDYVYDPFLDSLPDAQDIYWRRMILNTKPRPAFKNIDDCAEQLQDTIKRLKVKLLPQQEKAIIGSMAAKDYYLIQGPPGTGKSFVLALIIIEEIVYFNHNVIVVGPNHMAINNVLGQLLKMVPRIQEFMIKVGQPYNAPQITVMRKGKIYRIENIPYLDVSKANNADDAWVIGMTPHSLYTRRARGLECDTLIIDEAGQMTIPLALMGMIKANKVILAGDHKQLPPIITADKVEDELKQSVFQALITKDNCTMLDVSFRMCEPICRFVSDLFYDSKVKPYKKGCGDLIVCDDPLYDFETPIVIHHVADYGEQTSDKEARFIANTIARFIEKGLPADEIAVLSPFRAQAANIKRHIRRHPLFTVRQRNLIVADTIDKMQGQEREVIIYSLVSGDLNYMREMADFLYNPNKMNVAFSRAKSKLIIVGNLNQIRRISESDYPHLHRMLKSKYIEYV